MGGLGDEETERLFNYLYHLPSTPYPLPPILYSLFPIHYPLICENHLH
jgi:hypothetical protein